MWRVYPLLAGLTLCASACFAPSPQEGLPCAGDGSCPEGQVCTPTNVCVTASDEPGPGAVPDARAVATPDASGPVLSQDGGMSTPGCNTGFAVANISSCPFLGPAETWTGEVTIDTDTSTVNGSSAGVLVDQSEGGGQVMLLAFASLSIDAGATVRATGARPLVIVVQDDLDIAGSLSVSGTAAGSGAGGSQACGSSSGSAGTQQTYVSSIAGSGGGGGAFADSGGTGAPVDKSGATATAGGIARGQASLRPLLGGCSGGAGGPGLHRGAASAGSAGGALELVAGGTLRITGSVEANGGGGAHAPQEMTPANNEDNFANGGGAGGGSGGGILLQGGEVDVAGTVTANGGGGGEGSWFEENAENYPAADGADGSNSLTTRASGGNLDSTAEQTTPPHGGAGGAGGANADDPACGKAGSSGCDGAPGFSTSFSVIGGAIHFADGGGGGGGSAGRIRVEGIISVTISGLVSPDPG